MPNYNIKREVGLYIIHSGLKYRVYTWPDLSFSQTFSETSYKVKTLHEQEKMYEGAVVNLANPANFEFTIPITHDSNYDVIFSLLLDYDTTSAEQTLKTFDLYMEYNDEIYKIEGCVMESGIFRMVKGEVPVLTVNGTGTQITNEVSIPLSTESQGATQYASVSNYMKLALDATEIPSVVSISLEATNSIEWLNTHKTLHNSLDVSVASDTMYPEAFVVNSRQLSGSATCYVTDETTGDSNTWDTQSVEIDIGNDAGTPAVSILIPAAIVTNRLVGSSEILTHTFDFRMTSNPSDVTTVITKE